jgi:dynein heavy chain, axonemal
MYGSWTALDAEAVDRQVNNSHKTMIKAGKTLASRGNKACASNCRVIQDEIGQFKPYVPLVYALRNPGMRERHWQAMAAALGREWHPDDNFTLSNASALGFLEERNLKEILKVADVASKEFAIEQALDKMAADWESVELGVLPYRETGTFVIKVLPKCRDDDARCEINSLRKPPIDRAAG